MPIEQRNLDDRTYADLVEEARRLIPAYDPEWTDHNPSDPGITLIELFAYLTEILMYRMNRITDANQTQFLKLLNGPDWKPSGDLTADTRAAVQGVRTRFRAVTPSDFELVATDDFNALLTAMRAAEKTGNPLEDMPLVERARCIPGRNLDRGTEAERVQADPGHVSLIVVPSAKDASGQDVDAFHPPASLCEGLRGFLDERRILTTRVRVVATSFAPISTEIVLARTSGAVEDNLHMRVAQKLQHFLDPRVGGASQRGWPFGRDVYVSELIEQLETVPGVDYITDLMLFSVCDGNDGRCVPAPSIWHAEGDLVGLALAEHHLPRVPATDWTPPVDWALVTWALIKSAPSERFVAAIVTVNVTNPSAGAATVKRAVKQAIRTFFHPHYATPDPAPNENVEFKLAQLQATLANLTEVKPGTISLAIDADAQRLSTANGNVVGLVKAKEEMVDWRAVVTVTP